MLRLLVFAQGTGCLFILLQPFLVVQFVRLPVKELFLVSSSEWVYCGRMASSFFILLVNGKDHVCSDAIFLLKHRKHLVCSDALWEGSTMHFFRQFFSHEN